MRKTKIICTIGPGTDDVKILKKLMKAGMNVARLNFSHGDHEEQLARANRIKQARKELNLPVALLLDTKGPEIRTLLFKDDRVNLQQDDIVTISHEEVLGTKEQFSVTYKNMHKALHVGSMILIDDGLIELKVIDIEDKNLRCVVVNGGEVSNHKSINLPNVDLDLPALTDADIEDIDFAVREDFDFIAASFVRKASDVLEIRKALRKAGGRQLNIIAKIENREGVRNFEEILEVVDGVMVARGDLGVEIPAHEVPTIQKNLIQMAYKKGKPSITATQMLDSMIRSPRPTRAEVSDVANAVIDGTSAIMLSGETAIGKYPIKAVKMMDEIARFTEQSIPYWENFRASSPEMLPSVANAISHACCTTAMDLSARAIVCVTHSGRTARLLSRFRPACPIVATTVSETSMRQLSISWGVMPYLIPVIRNTDELFETAMNKALEGEIVKHGDTVVISGGTPVAMSGTTNTLKVGTIGSMLCKGKSMGMTRKPKVSGDALVINGNLDELDRGSENDYIVVATDTTNKMLPFLRNSKAIVVETDDPTCHAITVGESLEIPVIYGARNACKIISQGKLIVLDLESGVIS